MKKRHFMEIMAKVKQEIVGTVGIHTEVLFVEGVTRLMKVELLLDVKIP